MADENPGQIEASPIELATEVTIAWLNNPNNKAAADDVPAFLKAIHATLTGLTNAIAESAPIEVAQEFVPAVPVKSSVKPDHIVSLINGQKLKTLKRHLAVHGLTPATYRERFGLKTDYPMVAPNYSEARRAVAVRLGLGNKSKSLAETAPAIPAVAKPAPRITKAQTAKAKPAKKGSVKELVKPTPAAADPVKASSEPAPLAPAKPKTVGAAKSKPKTGPAKTGASRPAVKIAEPRKAGAKSSQPSAVPAPIGKTTAPKAKPELNKPASLSAAKPNAVTPKGKPKAERTTPGTLKPAFKTAEPVKPEAKASELAAASAPTGKTAQPKATPVAKTGKIAETAKAVMTSLKRRRATKPETPTT